MDCKIMKEAIINTIVAQLEIFIQDTSKYHDVLIELETLLNNASPHPKTKQKFNFTQYVDGSTQKKDIINHFNSLSDNILGYDTLFHWLYNNEYL